MPPRPLRIRRRVPAAVAAVALLACSTMSNPELPDFDREWNYADPAATEARFREIYTSAEGSADADYLAELTTQIARTYSLRGRFDEAHDELDELAPKLQGAGAAPRVRYLLERARTHNSAGEKERATELFLQAWEIAHEAGEEYHAADALHMLGLSTPPEEGLKWNERAMEYCESCTDPLARRWLGPLYHNTWMTYLEREDYDTALELAQKSRAFRDETDDDEGERIGRWSIFHTQRKMGRVDEALAGFRALLTDYGPEGDDSGFCDEEIAECLHALGREDEAKPHFAAAYEHLKDVRWLRESDPARLARLRQLAGE